MYDAGGAMKGGCWWSVRSSQDEYELGDGAAKPSDAVEPDSKSVYVRICGDRFAMLPPPKAARRYSSNSEGSISDELSVRLQLDSDSVFMCACDSRSCCWAASCAARSVRSASSSGKAEQMGRSMSPLG